MDDKDDVQDCCLKALNIREEKEYDEVYYKEVLMERMAQVEFEIKFFHEATIFLEENLAKMDRNSQFTLLVNWATSHAGFVEELSWIEDGRVFYPWHRTNLAEGEKIEYGRTSVCMHNCFPSDQYHVRKYLNFEQHYILI